MTLSLIIYWGLRVNLPKVLEETFLRKLSPLLGLSILSPEYVPLDWKDEPKGDLPRPYTPLGLREDRLLKELQQVYDEIGLDKEAKLEDYGDFIKLVNVKGLYYVVDCKQEIINNSQIVIKGKNDY